ncbi:hypothetical protein KJ891_01310, partial [Candidatus Micrarchaeota archaeon]|nr:hypothetical protein [Candidatus Micrarchaeota archaeon]
MQAVSIPKINGGAKSTRDAIISLLSSKWPLSAKEIYGRLAREHGFEGTYQAVHKAIAQALAEGVVVREGKGYSLSKEWIE